MLGSFYAERGLNKLYDLLDSLADVQISDPGFCACMDVAGDLIFVDLEEAWKTLEQTFARPLFVPALAGPPTPGTTS
jgi:hypothetical protein